MIKHLEELNARDYFRILRLHKAAFLFLVPLVGIFVWLYQASLPNIYIATTRILIETDNMQVVRFQPDGVNRSNMRFLQTEYKIISNPVVLDKVVEKLHLSAFPPFSHSAEPSRLLQRMVSVTPVRGTKLVDISVRGGKPNLIAKIANATADTYAESNLERQTGTTSGGIKWLKQEVDEMAEKMQEAQLKLQDFREQYSSIDFSRENQSSLNRQVQGINASLSKTRDDRISAEATFRDKHPRLKELIAKERDLQQALAELQQKALTMGRLSIQYNALLREAKTSEEIYNVLLTRLKELSVQESLQSNNVQVVNYAEVPNHPVGPNRRFQTTKAMGISFVLLFLFFLLRDVMNQTIFTRAEFERSLQIPFLGYIPRVAGPGLKKNQAAFKSGDAGGIESIRSIRATLEFILPPKDCQTLLVTSALPKEGKSSIALALATSLKELGKEVLLIDGDLRRPTLHTRAGINIEPGLSTFLQGQASEMDIVQTIPSCKDLHAIASGISTDLSTELLSGEKTGQLFAYLRERYAYIIIDSPPVLAVADATIFSSHADGIIFVTASGKTHQDIAVEGKSRLVDVGGQLVGGILNGVPTSVLKNHQYYYYTSSKH